MESIIDKVTGLSQQQRIEARHKARGVIIERLGKSPIREDYITRKMGKYPAWVISIVIILIIVVLITAFTLSAMRLYDIGNSEFYKTISDHGSAKAAGISIILLAEASAVLFMIATSVIGDSRLSKSIMLGLAFLATMIALSGNYFVALYGRDTTLFSWLEALSPPVITIGTSYILERVIFALIEQRHRDQVEFEKDLLIYREKASNPENDDYFDQAFANALWDRILDANRDRRRKHEGKPFPDVLAQLPSIDKVVLVQREISADTWFKPAKEERKEETVKSQEYKLSEVVRQPGFMYAPSQAKHSDQK